MGFSRQEYWSGLPCPSPEDLPNPETEPVSLASLELAGRFFPTVSLGRPAKVIILQFFKKRKKKNQNKMTIYVNTFSFSSNWFLLCLHNTKYIRSKFHPWALSGRIKGNSFWALHQTKVWAKWGMAWALIFKLSLCCVFFSSFLYSCILYLVLQRECSHSTGWDPH